jgi:hypothetical protein
LVKNQYDQQAGKLIVSMPFCFAKASNPFATLKLDFKENIGFVLVHQNACRYFANIQEFTDTEHYADVLSLVAK